MNTPAKPATDYTDVTVMGLCETLFLTPRPGQLYRFVIMPGCDKCAKLAESYAPGSPAHDPESWSRAHHNPVGLTN